MVHPIVTSTIELFSVLKTLNVVMLRFRGAFVVAIAAALVFAVALCSVGCGREAPAPLRKPALPDGNVYEALLDRAISDSRVKVLLDQQSAKVEMERVSYADMFPAKGAEASYRPQWAPNGGSPVSKREWKEASESLRLRNLSRTKLPLFNRSKLFSMVSRIELGHAFQKTMIATNYDGPASRRPYRRLESGQEMPTYEQLPTILEKVRNGFDESRAPMRVTGHTLDDGWLTIAVEPTEAGIRASDYANLMSKV